MANLNGNSPADACELKELRATTKPLEKEKHEIYYLSH